MRGRPGERMKSSQLTSRTFTAFFRIGWFCLMDSKIHIGAMTQPSMDGCSDATDEVGLPATGAPEKTQATLRTHANFDPAAPSHPP